MAKAVKWQIPFVSTIDKTNYRIDIYAEGYSGDPIQLLGGPEPIVTEEDKSEDFFAPVRYQTGNIQICTHDDDGNVLVTLEDIIPANNIDHPLRLVSILNGVETIEWQGFLSCEAYNQDYTSIPQILSLPILSVLEAMDSVQLDQTRSNGFVKIGAAIKNALNEVMLQSGMNFYTNINYSSIDDGILNKYIDQNAFFDEKEYTNENISTYIVDGISVKDVISRLCGFMGWTAREQGTKLYFERIGNNNTYTQEDTYTNFGSDNVLVLNPTNIVTADIADLQWLGKDHQRSLSQGAKSVAVNARVDHYDFSLKLPDFPYGDTTSVEWKPIKYKSNTFKYFYSLLNDNNNAYSNNAYGYYYGSMTRTGDSQYSASFGGQSNKANFYDREYLHPFSGRTEHPLNYNPIQAGAALMQYAIEDEQTSNHDMKSGLYVCLLPGCSGQDAPLFKMWTPRFHSFNKGKFVISANMLFNALYRYNSVDEQIMSDNISDSYIACNNEKLDLVLKVGNYYWTGSAWSTTRSIFQAEMKDNGINMNIPVNSYISGQVQLEVLAGVTVGDHVNTLYEVIFNSLDVSFEHDKDYQSSPRTENKYFQKLNTFFKEEITVSVELASYVNNEPSPTIVMNSASQPMTTLAYSDGSHILYRYRPEVDLLTRLASYYGAARQRLELKVAHPTSAPLPLLKLNGIGDGKTYLPLAETRDWREDVCTLTCFEMP